MPSATGWNVYHTSRTACRGCLSAALLLVTLGGCASKEEATDSAQAAPVLSAEPVVLVDVPTPMPAAQAMVSSTGTSEGSGTAALEAASVQDVSPIPSATPAELTWSVIGTSSEGRDLRTHTFEAGPQKIYLIAAIHGNEPEGLLALPALLEEVQQAADHAGHPRATLRVLEDVNPDGTAASSRYSSRGIDLNRNWPASNFVPHRSRGPEPLSEPETKAAHADLEAFGPRCVVVLHSIESGPFVNFDGPAAHLAEAFADAASLVDPRWKVRPAMGYPTPGSIGSYVGVDHNIPILTVEFDREEDRDLVARALVAGMDALARELQGSTVAE